MKKEPQQIEFAEIVVLGVIIVLFWILIDKSMAFLLAGSLSPSQIHSTSTFVRGAFLGGVIMIYLSRRTPIKP